MANLGGFQPDLGDFGHDGLVVARNVLPGFNSRKEPVPAPSAFTTALPAAWKGGGWFSGIDGNTVLLAGTSAHLYTLTASAATSVDDATLTSDWWFFDQFGDTIIACYGGAPLKYTLSTGVAADLGGSPPDAQFVAVVKDMVVLAGDTANANRVYNSALNDCEGWTVGTNEADYTDIPDGGPITGLAGGENLRIFQDSAINVMEYVGGDDIFIRRKISNSIGALCQGGIATEGGVDYFFHRSGFHRLVPGGEPEPIGVGKVDNTFRATYSDAEIQTSLKCTVDPVRKLIIWSMPGRCWPYNTVTGEWGDISITNLSAITLGATAASTLEEIAAIYPSIEDVTPNLDDPFWQGGYPILLIADSSDFTLYSLSGSNLAATITLPFQEPSPGRVTHARLARIISDATTGLTVSIGSKARLGDNASVVTESGMRNSGDTPIRASGRYLQPTIATEAGAVWTYIQGIELQGSSGGLR